MLQDYNPKCDIFGALIGGAFGMGAAAYNNEMARQREAEARAENYRYGEMQAANADARTRALYNDLQSPGAMMRQIKEAGLSPSLMYGGGMGGSVGAGAQGAPAAVSPTTYGVSAMEAAQIGLIAAETKKTEAETTNISTNTDKQKAEIDNIIQNTKNAALMECWQELQNGMAQMDLNLKGEYAEEQIKADLGKVYAETNNLIAMLESIQAKGKIDKESADAIITYNRNKVIEQAADIFLKNQQAALAKANINLTNAQIEKLFNDIFVSNEIVKVARRKVSVDENKLDAQIKQWQVENGLRQKEINVQLTKSIFEFYNGMGANFARTLDALIPF